MKNSSHRGAEGAGKKRDTFLRVHLRFASGEIVRAKTSLTADAARRMVDAMIANTFDVPDSEVSKKIIGCAACDRGDFQLGHSDECLNKNAVSP